MAIKIDCRHCEAGSVRDDTSEFVAERMAAAHSKQNPGHSVQVTEVGS